MLNPTNSFKFYVNQIERAVNIYRTNQANLLLLRDPIYSFFSNSEVSYDHFNLYTPIHFSALPLYEFINHDEFSNFFHDNHELFYEWIQSCYYYWVAHDPMKNLGVLIFPDLILFLKPNNITYRYQLISLIKVINYLVEYNHKFHLKIAETILFLYHQFLDDDISWEIPVLIVQELIFSRKTEIEEIEEIEEIRLFNLDRLKKLYDENYTELHESIRINILLKLLFHDKYYDSSYKDLIDSLKVDSISNSIISGNTEYLKSVFANVFSKSDYSKCMELLSIINRYKYTKKFSSQHGLLVPNNKIFSILTNSEHVNYFSEEQYSKYCDLIKCENEALVVSTVLRDCDMDAMIANTGKNYGFPNKSFDFSNLLAKTIDCYSLNADIYQEINYLTIAPSHSHPIQAALSHLGKVPPIINYSLNELKDFSSTKKFAFFLGENTLLPDYEKYFINLCFSKENLVIENPSKEKIIEVFNDPSFTHIYISAHGNYEHSSLKLDSFEFSSENKISVDIFDKINNEADSQRVIIMNACSGAHSGINLNFFHKGISSNLLKNNFAVFSNLWPISSEYSVVLGMLLVYKLKNMDDLRTAYNETFSILKMSNKEISESLISLDETCFEKLALKIFNNKNYDNNFVCINDFRNIGAMCLYN